MEETRQHSIVSFLRHLAHALFAVTLLIAPLRLVAQELVAVPSGLKLWLHEIRREADHGIVRYRFIAPEISRDVGKVSFQDVEADLEALCQTVALPSLTAEDTPTQIVISLSDRAVEFGQSNPDATQFFEAFSLQDGRCVWEGF